MTISMFQVSVPVFLQGLQGLKDRQGELIDFNGAYQPVFVWFVIFSLK